MHQILSPGLEKKCACVCFMILPYLQRLTHVLDMCTWQTCCAGVLRLEYALGGWTWQLRLTFCLNNCAQHACRLEGGTTNGFKR